MLSLQLLETQEFDFKGTPASLDLSNTLVQSTESELHLLCCFQACSIQADQQVTQNCLSYVQVPTGGLAATKLCTFLSLHMSSVICGQSPSNPLSLSFLISYY